MIYRIEHRIETLVHNAVMDERQSASFDLLDVHFLHWNFEHRNDWSHNYWLATGSIEAPNLDQGLRQFREKLARIIPRVALIGQCYIESVFQPFLVLRKDKDVAFFRFIRDSQAVGLMFMDRELKALKRLIGIGEVPEEFYYYWNDAVNATAYSSKLLLMFSAIEALVKIRDGSSTSLKDWDKLERILGEELKRDLWGERGDSTNALRHRLVHGEYFNPEDSEKNYLELVHKKIIAYFNESIFREGLIEESVVNPQRHFFGNREGWRGFLRARERNQLNLKDVLAESEKKGFESMEQYEFVYDNAITENY